jgi:hypothetical protein
MTDFNLSASRWLDLDASLASHCSYCRHSEFIYTESGPSLFSECRCPRLFPTVELLSLMNVPLPRERRLPNYVSHRVNPQREPSIQSIAFLFGTEQQIRSVSSLAGI